MDKLDSSKVFDRQMRIRDWDQSKVEQQVLQDNLFLTGRSLYASEQADLAHVSP